MSSDSKVIFHLATFKQNLYSSNNDYMYVAMGKYAVQPAKTSVSKVQ